MNVVQLMGNMLLKSIISGIIICLVLCVTPLLKKYTRRWRYIVFLVIGLQLILPASLFSIEPMVTIPISESGYTGSQSEAIQTNSVSVDSNAVDKNSAVVDKNTAINNSVGQNNGENKNSSIVHNSAENQSSQKTGVLEEIKNTVSGLNINLIIQIAFIVWVSVAAVLIAFYLIIYRYHKYNIQRWSRLVTDEKILEIFEDEKQKIGITKQIRLEKCRKIKTPMAVGIIHTAILIPEIGSDYNQLRYILRHELIHQKNRDMYAKIFFVLVKSIHWFNPMVHIMTKNAYDDMELLCDDEVVKYMERDQRISYNETILNVARKQALYDEPEEIVFSFGLVQDKNDLKERMLNIMNTKNRKKGYVVALIMCATVVLGGSMIACGKVDEDKSKTKVEETTTEEATTKAEEATTTMPATDTNDLQAIETDNRFPIMLKAAEFAEYTKNCYATDKEKFGWFAIMVNVSHSYDKGYFDDDEIKYITTEEGDSVYEVQPEVVDELADVYLGTTLSPDTISKIGYEDAKYDSEKKVYYFPSGDIGAMGFDIENREIKDDGTMVVKGNIVSGTDDEKVSDFTIIVRCSSNNRFGFAIESVELTNALEQE